MKYITYNNSNGRIAHIGEKRPISYSDSLELIEVENENIPSYNPLNGEYLTVANGVLTVNQNPAFIRRKRIAELKSLLASTDYQAIKFAEGFITAEDYEPIKAQRQAYRVEINELEIQQ